MATTFKKPRKRPAPSERDQHIFLEYEVHGLTQNELAEKHGLTQCRVSQIYRRVKAWNATADAGERGMTTRQEQRLDRLVERERLNFVAREALRRFFSEQRTVTTEKNGERGDKTFQETVKRELAANVQWLKVMLQANVQLTRLEQKPEIPPETQPDEQRRQRIVFEELRKLRDQAEREGRVSQSTDGWDLIQRWIDALIGEVNHGKAPERAARELAEAIVPAGECEAAAHQPAAPARKEEPKGSGAFGTLGGAAAAQLPN